MARKRQIIELSEQELSSLTSILSKKTSARQQTRARALDLLHRREHPKTIANLLNVGAATVYLIQKRYLTEGFQSALYDKPRSGKPPVIKAEAKARLTALACTDAPAGHFGCWQIKRLSLGLWSRFRIRRSDAF